MPRAIGSITPRSRRAGSSEASIQNAGSNGKNATCGARRQRVAQRLLGSLRSGRRGDHEHEIRRELAPTVGPDRETGLVSGVRDALAARDLDQVGLEAVAAGDHERLEAHHGDDPRTRLSARLAADPCERTGEGALETARLLRA